MTGQRTSVNGRGSHAAPLTTLAIALLITMAPYAAASASHSVTGSFEAARILIDGPAEWTGQAVALGAPVIRDDPDAEDWMSIHAEGMEITVTVDHSYGVGGLVRTPAPEPREERHYFHGNAAAMGVPTARQSWILVTPLHDETTFGIEGSPRLSLLEPSASVAFESTTAPLGPTADATQGVTDTALSYHNVQWDRRNVQVNTEGTTPVWTFTGDLRLMFYDFEFEVLDGAESSTYQTGLVPVDDSMNVPGATQQYEERRAEVILHNATITYAPAGRPLSLHLSDVALDVAGKVQVQDATGEITLGASPTPLRSSLLALEVDSATLATHATSSSEPRLEVTLSGDASNVYADGRELNPSAVATAWWRGGNPLPASVLSLAAVAGGALMIKVVRGRRVRAREDIFLQLAQEEYARGSYRKASRVASRLVRQDPANADAAVIASMALLKAGKPKRVLRRMTPAVRRTKDESGLFHLMLSMAHFEVGNPKEGQRVLREALERNPDLVDELHGTELLERVEGALVYRKPINGEAQSPSYV